MKHFVYFDSGTTNSRGYLIGEDGTLVDSMHTAIGSRDSAIAESNSVLIDGLYRLYTQLLAHNEKTDAQILEIYASGMVTSPYGLCEIPHLCLPISVADFSKRLHPYFEAERFQRVMHLIPGLRTQDEDISLVNNLRGEEIEAIGIITQTHQQFANKPVGVVLPGSHTHTLLVRGTVIEDTLANFTGELYSSLSQDTILAPILNQSVDVYDPEMVCLGVKNLRKYGFTRALYICHSMRLFERETPIRRVSYAEGVILGGMCQSLDWYCQNRWQDLRDIVIVAEKSIAELYRMVLKNCHAPLSIYVMETRRDWIPALEGLKAILSMKESRG